MKLVHKGFTLIELLIVVAIIAILAAIAVPNFIEAQTRSKVARVKSDLRTYATGLEAYHIDERWYPVWLDPSGGLVKWHYEASQALIPLTTPISYLSQSRFRDPFQSAGRVLEGWTEEYRDSYIWAYYKWTGPGGTQNWPSQTFGDHWAGVPNLDAACVSSQGPGSWHTVPEWALAMYVNGQINEAFSQIYDPTNGTSSRGGIVRYVGDTRGFPNIGW